MCMQTYPLKNAFVWFKQKQTSLHVPKEQTFITIANSFASYKIALKKIPKNNWQHHRTKRKIHPHTHSLRAQFPKQYQLKITPRRRTPSQFLHGRFS